MAHSNGIKIRVSTLGDERKVTELLHASYPTLMVDSYPEDVLVLALPLMTGANPRLLGSGAFFVATDKDDALLGCGGWSLEEPGTQQHQKSLGHIRHFAVHPEKTGRGIGRRLFSACKEQAASQGVEKFNCFSSLNAVEFYSAMGLQRQKVQKVHLSPQIEFSSVLMVGNLANL